MNTRSLLVAGLASAFALSAGGCQTQEMKSQEAIEIFQQKVSGEWTSDSGSTLVMVPVRSRMVTDESIYAERTDASGTVGRLVALDWHRDKEIIVQRALMFATEGQWRNLRETPELFTALLPKDMKPAGTCDIKPSEDGNSVSFSCSGSPPEIFRRKS